METRDGEGSAGPAGPRAAGVLWRGLPSLLGGQPEAQLPTEARTPVPTLPLVSAFGDQLDVAEGLAALGYLEGRYPHMEQRLTQRRLTLEQLAGAPGLTVVRSQRYGDGAWAAWVVGAGYEAHCRSGPEGCELRAYAPDPATGAAAVEALLALAPATRPLTLHELPVIQQHWDRGTLVERRLTTSAPAWTDITENYAPATRAELALTIARPLVETAPRLLIVHGPPGTGKTTAVRALAHAWREWCDAVYVLDPDLLFAHANYLAATRAAARGAEDPTRWRLLVCEDGGGLVDRSAARDTLARLLGFSDGFVGRDERLAAVVVTNASREELHPAVLRPGRCLGALEVPALDRRAARGWIGPALADRIPARGATLAELYALLRGEALGEPRDPAAGPYV